MAVKWKWNNNTGGGNVPADLANRVQTLENEVVKKTGDQSIGGVKTFTSTNEVIKLNSGTNNSAYMAGYKSGNNRIWYFGKGSSTDDNLVIGSTADIKLEARNVIQCNGKKLTNVADPAANQDAANKQYVDNRIKTRTLTQTINTNSSFTVAPTQGYQLINVMIGRKRTSDNYFFFSYHETLNFQFYVNSSNNFIIWNQGNVSGFNNEYKIIITEMKV